MRGKYISNIVNPITGMRMNDFNKQFTEKVIKEMFSSFMRERRRKDGRQDYQIIDTFRKTRLADLLYGCLIEEDDERLRERVQALADMYMDEVVSNLVELGYTF